MKVAGGRMVVPCFLLLCWRRFQPLWLISHAGGFLMESNEWWWLLLQVRTAPDTYTLSLLKVRFHVQSRWGHNCKLEYLRNSVVSGLFSAYSKWIKLLSSIESVTKRRSTDVKNIPDLFEITPSLSFPNKRCLEKRWAEASGGDWPASTQHPHVPAG